MPGDQFGDGIIEVGILGQVRVAKVTKTLRPKGLHIIFELNDDIAASMLRRQCNHERGEHAWRFFGTTNAQQI